MPRAKLAAILLACLTLTVGCSGKDPYVATSASAFNAGSLPVESRSPLTGMSALEVWEKTKADADAAQSVRVAAKFLDGDAKIAINLRMTDSGKAVGTLVFNGDKIEVRRLGKTMYFLADRGFWASNADAATADLLGGKWIKVKEGFSADMEQFFELTDMDFIVADTMSLSVAEQQGLKLVPGIDINDEPTVGLSDESADGTDEFQTLYVAAADPALPMHFAMSADKSQYMKFRSWNKDFTVAAPKGAIDLAKAS